MTTAIDPIPAPGSASSLAGRVGRYLAGIAVRAAVNVAIAAGALLTGAACAVVLVPALGAAAALAIVTLAAVALVVLTLAVSAGAWYARRPLKGRSS